jgi:hypothetical protein
MKRERERERGGGHHSSRLLKEECCKTELTDKDNNCLCVKLVNQAKINIKKIVAKLS